MFCTPVAAPTASFVRWLMRSCCSVVLTPQGVLNEAVRPIYSVKKIFSFPETGFVGSRLTLVILKRCAL